MTCAAAVEVVAPAAAATEAEEEAKKKEEEEEEDVGLFNLRDRHRRSLPRRTRSQRGRVLEVLPEAGRRYVALTPPVSAPVAVVETHARPAGDAKVAETWGAPHAIVATSLADRAADPVSILLRASLPTDALLSDSLIIKACL